MLGCRARDAASLTAAGRLNSTRPACAGPPGRKSDAGGRGYNLDIKNPHTVADDHGDPEVLLESLNTAEAETASLRDQLKAILADALVR